MSAEEGILERQRMRRASRRKRQETPRVSVHPLAVVAGLLLTVGIACGVEYDLTLLGSHVRCMAVCDGQYAGHTEILDPNSKDLPHAVLWGDAIAGMVNLNPAWCLTSQIWDLSGNRQVGMGDNHALLWSGAAASVVDLHPDGFDYSCAYGVWGTRQVGVGVSESSGEHALLWSGTAASMVDLHPTGFAGSRAGAVWGGRQVGYGVPLGAGQSDWRALLWSGTAQSVVSLHPVGFRWSCASDLWGPWQVGSGMPADGAGVQALLWSGTAESVVSLHPGGRKWSYAVRCWGNQQVGMGDDHALLWSGTAESVVDLHRYVPGEYTRSGAFGIDSSGRIVGYVENDSARQAAVWTPRQVPFYRCWSPRHSRHAYATRGVTVESLVNEPNTWTFEGIVCCVLPDSRDPNAMPVYRFRSAANSADFFTIDSSERDRYFKDRRDTWTFEGIAFYAYRPQRHPSCAVAVYRLWSDVLNSHLYTASEAERDRLAEQFRHVWTDEGVAWYAHP